MQESVGIPLAPLTTMRVGGPAARLVTATTTDELVGAVREADAAGEPVLVVSGGSNLLIADEGFAGTVVRVATRGVRVESADYCGGVSLRVAAGEDWDALVARCVVEGWSGVEALSGIPGCAGSTPIQNVGAYGQEVSATIAQVRVWDRAGRSVRTLANADCAFGYRDSVLKRAAGRYLVLEVVLQLPIADLSAPVGYVALADELDVAEGTRVPLEAAREAVLALRRRRGMVLDEADHDTWSCGSFFTNPVLTHDAFAALRALAAVDGEPAHDLPCWPGADGSVKTSAAWLLEHAGYGRGFGMPGPAALSTKHPLAVTNRGGASAEDIVALARQVRDGVAATFGVTLLNEPVLVGLSL
ncbi:MAG: UDP-N-acetylmuramate dehydrogenase [Dermatophilaceae bacterium]